MNVPFIHLDAQALRTATPILILLLKATGILIASSLLARLLRGSSAGVRHLVWLTSLAALLVLPAASRWSPVRLAVLPNALDRSASAMTVRDGAALQPLTVQRGVTPASPNERARSVRSDATLNPSGTARRSQEGSQTATKPDEQRASDVPVSGNRQGMRAWTASDVVTLLAAAWGAVTLLVAGWLGHAAFSVRRIVGRSTVLVSSDWTVPLYEIADRLGVAQAPRLLLSRDTRMPFACGFVRPSIVLPAEAEDWTDARRRAVLLHELGHVRRRDLLGHTLGRVVCAVYWFHPLVWAAARRLRLESERACDDLAITCGARASEYAEHLLEIVSRVRANATPAVALPMARRSEFEGRMLAILDPGLRRSEPGRVQARLLVAGVGALAFVLAAAAPAPRPPTNDSSGMPRPGGNPEQSPTTQRVPDSAVKPSASSPRRDSVMSTRTLTSTVVQQTTRVDSSRSSGSLDLQMTEGVSAMKNTLEDGRDAGARTVELREDGYRAPQDSQRVMLLARVLTSDTSARLRRIAAWGLSEHADEDLASKALVAALTRDADAAVREMAAWALADGGRSDRLVREGLVNALSRDASADVRFTAAWSLGSRGDDEAPVVDALQAAAVRDSARVKAIAIWALGNVSLGNAPPVLLEALRDKDKQVRELAAWALHNIQDPKANRALMAAYQTESDRAVKIAMVRALTPTGDEAAAMLADLLDSKDEGLRDLAVRSLAGEMGNPWPWPWPRPRPTP
jgi:beta-lactamase regulating signal transducer with metallopeptidase domain/HEAT repeat protein